MHKSIGHILEREFSAARPEVAIAIPIALQISIDGAHHRECPYVELSVLVEQRLLDVLLNYVGPPVAIHVHVLDQTLDVIELFAHLYATTSICVLTWFDYPQVLAKLWHMVKNGSFVWILSIMEQLLELQEGWVVETFLDVERKRQMMMILFTYCLTVDLHVVVYGLLVAQVIIVLHLCVCQQIM